MPVNVPFLIKSLCFGILRRSDQVEQPRGAESVETVDPAVIRIGTVWIQRDTQAAENDGRPEVSGVNGIGIYIAAQIAPTANETECGVGNIGSIEGSFSVFNRHVLVQVGHEVKAGA